jgi:lysophospholipase L1-like esterase
MGMFAGRRWLAAWLLVAVLPSAGAAQPSPQSASPVVFVGSSIFHRWTNLSAQMAPLPVVNLAFDGALTFDMLRLVDRATSARPKVIVYYAGSNDVDAGEPAAAVFDRIRQFMLRAWTASPETHVIFVSINRAPEKEDRWNVVDDVNRRVQAYAGDVTRLQYVDVNPVLFNRDGSPRLEVYMPDQLHLRPPAYDAFAQVLRPAITKAFNAP